MTLRCRFARRVDRSVRLCADAARHIVLPLAAVVMIGAVPMNAGATVVDQLLAVVNGNTIALSDLIRFRLLFGQGEPPERSLREMIDQMIVIEELQRFESSPPETELIRDAVRQLRTLHNGPGEWESVLRHGHLSDEAIRQLVTERVRVESFLTQRVDVFIFVSSVEIEAVYDASPERFEGLPLQEVEPLIEQELQKEKITAKRQKYITRLRSRATIVLIGDIPSEVTKPP